MKCDVAQDWLVLLAYSELGDADIAELEMHLRQCASCTAESERWQSFIAVMAADGLAEPDANLLAESRMKLDARLDEIGMGGWRDRLRSFTLGSWAHITAAPALATLLLGAGFLGGNLLNRYQVAHAPQRPAPMLLQNQTEGVVGTVNGIVQTSNPDVVQVKYNRVVPETMQGSLDDPQIRQLLMLGAQSGVSTGVRENSVSLLAAECRAGHRCESANGNPGTGVRDALLVSLRYDHNPSVRLKALAGLQPYISADQRVRDAVLESLMNDKSAEVRSHAIDVLEPVQADSSVRQVMHTVSTQDANPYIRNASTQALEGMDGLQ